jgi:hypothetical protein
LPRIRQNDEEQLFQNLKFSSITVLLKTGYIKKHFQQYFALHNL